MKLRFSLFTKILLWFFLNLVVLGAVFLIFFNLQFRFAPDSLLSAAAGNKLGSVARLIADEMRAASPSERVAILRRYSSTYQVEFMLYANTGEKLAGPDEALPEEIRHRLTDAGPPPPPAVDSPPPLPAGDGHPPPPEGRPPRFEDGARPPAPRPNPIFTLKTAHPTRYWAGVPFLVFDQGQAKPLRATLLAASDSITGHGLFFDPKPWLLIIAIVLALSIILWFPFVRSLTMCIKQMTAATEQIAEEHFDTRVNERRSDELGRLGTAVNQLAARLENFVGGQKRFLGGISHELNSPLARMQLALGILEERIDPAHAGYVADAQEEVRLMSRLVSELLAFAKAGMKAAELQLCSVPLRPLVQELCLREVPACTVAIDIDESVAVLAQPELLSRAVANVLRNSARYAAGTIDVAVVRQGDQVKLTISDRGPGVPAEALHRIFDPLFRLEPDRARASGGSGLGLAIVKTCIEACQGTVTACNLDPTGLEISMLLKAA